MHDLVHDLARVMLGDQVNDNSSTGGKGCRYALLTDCNKPLQLSVSSPGNIKALRFLDCGREIELGGDVIRYSNLPLRGDAFSPAKCLRVLDLSGCFIESLPDSIGQLKRLRFLHAPRIQEKMIPKCITELSELNYLNLRGSCNMSALPESIGDMKCLMHLDLSQCFKLNELPTSFAELKQLVHLDLSHSHVSISEAFCGFTKLQYLNLSFNLSFSGENCRWTLEFIGNLNKFRYLNLSGCMNGMDPSQDQIGSMLDPISTLSNLEHLNLSENNCLSSIPESMCNLRKLHTLDLFGCSLLKKLPDSMVNLKFLKVDMDVTSYKSVRPLLNAASLSYFVVHASSHNCSSNIILLQRTNPVKLMIDRLENVKSAEEAQSVKLIEKQNIKELTFQWTVAADRFLDDDEVLEKLVPPSSVQKLYVNGYMSARFPEWLMDIIHHLPNLLVIHFCDFPNCNNLQPLGQLPQLRQLNLCRMEGLEEWNTEYTSGKEGVNELMFPELMDIRYLSFLLSFSH